MTDEIDRKIESLVDAALDELYDKFDRLRDEEGLTDEEMISRVERETYDMADGYAEWIRDGLETGDLEP